MFDLVLIEKEGDSGLTKTDITNMIPLLSDEEYYPVEYYNRGGESCAMGFITRSAANDLDFEYDDRSELGDFVGGILADMNLESENGTYKFTDDNGCEIQVFLTRNLPSQDDEYAAGTAGRKE